MILLLDVGNSRIKWATLDHGRLMPGTPLSTRAGSAGLRLREAFRALPAPRCIRVSNVAGEAAAQFIVDVGSELWSLRPEFVSVERERMGLRVAYADCSRLGVDRWLATLAAWHHFRGPLCVVDCGTAVTVDAVDGNGAHLGGWIVPGLAMMREMLVNGTAGIAAVPGDATPEFGLSTSECVNNGSVVAIAALVDRAVLKLSSRAGAGVDGLITGGAAELLLPAVFSRFEYDPNLVLRGLALLAPDH